MEISRKKYLIHQYILRAHICFHVHAYIYFGKHYHFILNSISDFDNTQNMLLKVNCMYEISIHIANSLCIIFLIQISELCHAGIDVSRQRKWHPFSFTTLLQVPQNQQYSALACKC